MHTIKYMREIGFVESESVPVLVAQRTAAGEKKVCAWVENMLPHDMELFSTLLRSDRFRHIYK